MSNGKIYIGRIDTDPTIPENQIQVYLENEDGSTIPVAQPLIINQAGFPVYNGQIAKFVTVEGHSMAVYDSYGAQQFYYPNVLKYDPDQFEKRVSSVTGAELVGSGPTTVAGRYAFSGKIITDLLTKDELSRLLSDDKTLDLSDKLQSLIDERKPFYLAPNVKHYCHKSLRWKSGAKMRGAGAGTNQRDDNAWSVDTALVFDSKKTDVGIILVEDGWVSEWEISGITIDTVDAEHGLRNFTPITCLEGSDGAYNGKLHAYIRNAKLAVENKSTFWNVDLDLRISYCYKPFVSKGGTSLSGWIKTSFCFHGIDIKDVVYSQLNLWFDQCGLSAPSDIVDASPHDELPILMKTDGCVGVRGVLGVERSKAQLYHCINYSALSYSLNYQPFGDKHSFYKDENRTSNVTINHQGLIHTGNSTIKISDVKINNRVSNGFPEAVDGEETYFITGQGFDSRVTFENSYVYAINYCVCPSHTLEVVCINKKQNSDVKFGLENISKVLDDLEFHNDYVPLRLKYGAKDVSKKQYHRIYRDDTVYVEGDLGLEVSPAQYAAPIRFYAVNSPSESGAKAAMSVPKSATTGRSINAGGTVNTNGSDYAEYMGKAYIFNEDDNFIFGIDKNGKVTDRYDDAIKFCLKSNDPSFVGGDNWFDENSISDNMTEDEIEMIYEQSREAVILIAFCGQVEIPVSVEPGFHILPACADDGSISIDIKNELTLSEYMSSVGQVISTQKGKSVVIVKI
ncbi:hypothetical protein BML2496_23720 [Providencia rettgeri]|nr:hypothetical protein BML2496_23720 [Providencia rettgeri]